MATINKNKADSITIEVVLDGSINVADVNELVIYLGDKLSAKKSVEGQLTQVDNVFTWKIPSSDTLYLSGLNSVTVSANIDGYGERHTFEDTAPKINFVPNNNKQNSEAVSDDFVDVTINLSLVTGTLTSEQSLFTGFSSVETITIINKQDGDIIPHNLKGRITAEFFDTEYLFDERVSIEYVSNSTVMFKSIITNSLYNGYLRCTKI